MADEEKAEEYFLSLELEKENKIFQLKEVIGKMWKVYLDGLTEGRKEVCKKILEEMENRALSSVSATTLRNIFKDLGIEL